MIVWLASYPRSGNTLLRIILNEVFGVKTRSKHNDRRDIGSEEGIREAVGHEFLEGRWNDVYSPMSQASETFFVKTHDGPEDQGKAIYVVRNGFASILSYQNYLRDFANTEFTLAEVIAGSKGLPSWGYHLDLWNPLERPNTLLLKYEELVQSPEQQIERITRFCQIPPLKAWKNDFERLHAINPKFFRKGQAEDPSHFFPEECRKLCWGLHGDWMARLNYCAASPNGSDVLSELRKVVASQYSEKKLGELQQKAANLRALKSHWWIRFGRHLGVVDSRTFK
jgi:hypothetical protein